MSVDYVWRVVAPEGADITAEEFDSIRDAVMKAAAEGSEIVVVHGLTLRRESVRADSPSTYVDGYDAGGSDAIRGKDRRWPRLTRRQRVSWKYLGGFRVGYDDGYEDGADRRRGMDVA